MIEIVPMRLSVSAGTQAVLVKGVFFAWLAGDAPKRLEQSAYLAST
jgi:hypothetical protein